MNNGPITEADLQAFVDDRLPRDRAAVVAAWLEERPQDAARVADYRAQARAMREALEPMVREPLPPDLDLRLHHGNPQRSRWLVAPVACLLVLIGGLSGWKMREWTEPAMTGTAALAREAAASYAVYADDDARPVEIAANDLRSLDAWFSKRLSRTISAPDLRPAGLHLVGGRLVATEHGPACFYLYVNGEGERIALYVRPMRIDGAAQMVRRDEAGVRGWTWADRGLGFGVFGNASDDFLHRAADVVRASGTGVARVNAL